MAEVQPGATDNKSLPRSLTEFSEKILAQTHQSIKVEAQQLGEEVQNGADIFDVVRPKVTTTSIISQQMETDKDIGKFEKSSWQMICNNNVPEDEISAEVMNSILRYLESPGAIFPEDVELKKFIYQLESELVSKKDAEWGINRATRLDLFYRLKFLREVFEVATSKTHQATNESRIRALAVAPQARHIEGAISTFLTRKNPLLRSDDL